MSTSLPSLGKYQIIEEIGRGGMGVVFKGYDPDLKRTVAIKLLAPHLIWEKGFVERFLREARAAAQLDHPNIIHIFDVGQAGSNYYFVMTYLPGPSLKQFLSQRGRLTPAQALLILRQLADALDYAHSKGLVHRDVKSANVMFNELNQAVLTDFGLVKAAQESKLTITGAFLGTPQYMAPEQVQGTGVDARADEYALGIIAFEMLTGQVPFDADTTPAILYKQVNDPPPAAAALCRDLPPAIEPVLNRALAKSPANRYSSCGEFVRALEHALQLIVSPQHRASMPLSNKYRAELRHKLDYYFSEEELRSLCFDLGIDYEALPAQGKSGKARELIAELERARRLAELVELCRKLRPGVSWAEIPLAEPVWGPERGPQPARTPAPRPKLTTLAGTTSRRLPSAIGIGTAAMVLVVLIILCGIGGWKLSEWLFWPTPMPVPPTWTWTPTPTATTPTPTQTWTSTPTPTWTPTPSRTWTPTPTYTWTPTPSRTWTPTPSRTWTPTPSRTWTPTPSRTWTPTPSRTWTPTHPPTPVCSVQGIKRTDTSQSKVIFQVQYYVLPSYPRACFIGARVPENPSAFGYVPAGRLPNGIPKGQHYFEDNIAVQISYMGSQAFTSTKLEVMIYDQDQKELCSSVLNWGQTWRK